MPTASPPAGAHPEDSLIHYPCPFPIKVMGVQGPQFVAAMAQIAGSFDPGFDAALIEMRESKGGKYLGLTLTVTATSREQLDALYRAFSAHPLVKVVL